MKQGKTQEEFVKSLEISKYRVKMAGGDASRIRVFDRYFVAPGAVRACREAKEGPLKDEN